MSIVRNFAITVMLLPRILAHFLLQLRSFPFSVPESASVYGGFLCCVLTEMQPRVCCIWEQLFMFSL